MRMFGPAIAAKIIFKRVAGMKGNKQVVAAAEKGIPCSILKNTVPQSRFMILLLIRENIKMILRRDKYLAPNPVSKAITGKDQRKPPVGPTRHCRPPLKLEKTGRPIAPRSR